MASAAFQPDRRAPIVADALARLDITELDLWEHLDALSTHTRIEGIEVPVEGVVMSGDRFSAILNLYLSLQYGRNDDEGFTTSDSFRARVEGRLDGTTPTVETSSVDTSSFYE